MVETNTALRQDNRHWMRGCGLKKQGGKWATARVTLTVSLAKMAPLNPTAKKGIRIGKALKSGALKVVPGRKPVQSIATVSGPAPGEQPAFILKVQVIACKGLLGVDRNGKSDP